MARAKQGGEYGANGEFYKGGQFLNTVAENEKKAAKQRRRGPSRVEVGPYQWEDAREGFFPIFQLIGTRAAYVDRYDKSKGIAPFAPGVNYYGDTLHGHSVDDLCRRWNDGERWAEKIA